MSRGGITKRTPARTASPILKTIFSEMTVRGVRLQDMASRIRRHENRISEWRRGQVEPGVFAVEEMAHELGYRLTLAPIDGDDK